MKLNRAIVKQAMRDPVVKGACLGAFAWVAAIAGYQEFCARQSEFVETSMETADRADATPNAYCVQSGAFDPSNAKQMASLNWMQRALVRMEHEKAGTDIGDALLASNKANQIPRCLVFDHIARGSYNVVNDFIAFDFSSVVLAYMAGDKTDVADALVTDAEESAHAWQMRDAAPEEFYDGDYPFKDQYLILQAIEGHAKVIAQLTVLPEVPVAAAHKDESIYSNGERKLENRVTGCFNDQSSSPDGACLTDAFLAFMQNINSYQARHLFGAALNDGETPLEPAAFTRVFGQIPGRDGNFMQGHLDYARIIDPQDNAVHPYVIESYKRFEDIVLERRQRKPAV